MSNPVDRLESEHGDFSELLDLLEAQIGLLHRGDEQDYGLMLDIVYYMKNYPDVLHHPREDMAFSILAERDPQTKDAVDDLARQHREIADSGTRFLENLDAALAGAILTREAVEVPGLQYISLYRSHMRAEECRLFPALRRHLNEADWTRIDDSIAAGHDPLFGPKVEARFQAIHRQISMSAA